mmetsp:Transcript_7341/g.29488  ORF Transcript_7341/g.29488 Transcript_7341/m.29488 type:complete len:268 (+) Transcript_7341:533-1336(+)
MRMPPVEVNSAASSARAIGSLVSVGSAVVVFGIAHVGGIEQLGADLKKLFNPYRASRLLRKMSGEPPRRSAISFNIPGAPRKKFSTPREYFALISPMTPHEGIAPHSSALGVRYSFFGAFPITASYASVSKSGERPSGPRTMPPPVSIMKLDTPSYNVNVRSASTSREIVGAEQGFSAVVMGTPAESKPPLEPSWKYVAASMPRRLSLRGDASVPSPVCVSTNRIHTSTPIDFIVATKARRSARVPNFGSMAKKLTGAFASPSAERV